MPKCKLTLGLTFVAVVIILAVAFLRHVAGTPSPAKIAIVKTSSDKHYNDAVDGFRKEIAQEMPGIEIAEYDIENDKNKLTACLAEIKKVGTSLIASIGTTATAGAVVKEKEIPVAFTLVTGKGFGLIVRGRESKFKNATGVAMDLPPARQFEILKKVLPDAKRVGVVYSAEHSGTLIEQARVSASEAGLSLVAREISKKEEVPDALGALVTDGIDVLWGLWDPMVFVYETDVEYLLRFSIERRIPYLVSSKAHVEAGALLGIYADPGDLGRQVASQSILILRDGKKPIEIPVSVPRKALYALNLHVARIMKKEIPEDAQEGAEERFEE